MSNLKAKTFIESSNQEHKIDQKVKPHLNHIGFQKSASNFTQSRQGPKDNTLSKMRIKDEEIFEMRKNIGEARLEYAISSAMNI